ncbi:AfsR/SARP family transcriptional regulator [Flindersiella endophytica]
MRVRVLGPLEVSSGASWQRLSAPKQRALLAALVAHHGRPVPVDVLIEELWPARAPGSAVNLIQQYVGQLRRALGDLEARVLSTDLSGYTLGLPGDELDLGRFEALVNRGTTMLGTRDAGEAVDLLGRALDLWRGPAFADVPASPLLAVEADRLEQLRLSALESKVHAELVLGRHAGLVPELQKQVSTHPLRERFWSQLMLAQYRSGRRAEALETYQRLSDVLADELGVEPGPPARELRQQILVADPALDLLETETVPGRIELPVPAQLPAGVADFTGRAVHLRWLDDLLPDAAHNHPPAREPAAVTVAAISGGAGVGKTALTLHWAHQVSGSFPDGQLYVNLHGFDPSVAQTDPSDAVRGFLEVLGVRPERVPADLAGQTALYRSMLADRRMLVVLDNARDSEQVRPLLPGSAGSLVVVTSRDQLSGLIAAEGAYPLMLDLLSVDEARELLERRLGRVRTIAEPLAVEEIIAACARLPLALAIVAARAATHPQFSLDSLAAELRAVHGRLDAFSGADEATDVRRVFSWSYRRLGPAAARLFRLLGLAPGPDIAAAAAASLAGKEIAGTRQVLAELGRAHLLVEVEPGRYSFHDLLRAYALELCEDVDSAQEREAAMRRILDHYLLSAHSGAMVLYPQRDPIVVAPAEPGCVPETFATRQQVLTWFAAHHTVLLAGVELAAARGFDTHAWQLPWALLEYLDRRGHWHDVVTSQTRAVAAARRLGDASAEAIARRSLAAAQARFGRFDEAHRQLRRTLDLAANAGDVVGEAHGYRTLAWVVEQQGLRAEALRYAERALQLFQSAEHVVGQAAALNDVGWQHAQLGDYGQALVHSEKALEILNDCDNRHGQAATWESLGYAHHRLGEVDQAIGCYLHALDLYRELGVRFHEAETLTHLGDAYGASGDAVGARDCWRAAAAILEELEHPQAEQVRRKLAGLQLATGG